MKRIAFILLSLLVLANTARAAIDYNIRLMSLVVTGDVEQLWFDNTQVTITITNMPNGVRRGIINIIGGGIGGSFTNTVIPTNCIQIIDLGGGTNFAFGVDTNCIAALIGSGGTAGGDLSGTYPNPTIAKLQGTSITLGSPSTGQSLVWTNGHWTNLTVTVSGGGGGSSSITTNDVNGLATTIMNGTNDAIRTGSQAVTNGLIDVAKLNATNDAIRTGSQAVTNGLIDVAKLNATNAALRVGAQAVTNGLVDQAQVSAASNTLVAAINNATSFITTNAMYTNGTLWVTSPNLGFSNASSVVAMTFTNIAGIPTVYVKPTNTIALTTGSTYTGAVIVNNATLTLSTSPFTVTSAPTTLDTLHVTNLGTFDLPVNLASNAWLLGPVVISNSLTVGTNLTVGGAATITGNITGSGSLTVTGVATAGTFSGSGASLTALPAGNISGTIPIGNLPASVITNVVNGGNSGNGAISLVNNLLTITFPSGGGSVGGTNSISALNGSLTGTVYIALNNGTVTLAQSGSAGTLTLYAGKNVLAGWHTAISPADFFGWTSSGGSTASNGLAPVYWQGASGTLNTNAFAMTSSATNAMQDKYAFASLRIPPWATGFNTTALVFSAISSSTSTNTNDCTVAIYDGLGNSYTTNHVISTTANSVTHYYILASSLPAFSHDTDTNGWTVRFDFFGWQTATTGISRVRANYN